MHYAEFVALIAMLFSTVAFSMDAMLPAFPAIEAEFGAEATGQAYLIVSLFMGGLGLGTFFAGPISDAIGRRPTMFLGAGLYILSALVAWLSTSFEVILAARFAQGLAAAGPRVVSLAIIRDLYAGREMARITSLAMVLFTITPTIAPLMGDLITRGIGWRGIFLAFLVFGVISALWMWARLGESLPADARRPFSVRNLWTALQEIIRHPTVRLAILAQTMAMSLLLLVLVMIQPIYDQVFDRAESFPYWFGGIALVSATTTSLLNAALVVRFGMRPLVTLGMAGQVISAALAFYVTVTHPDWGFGAFVVWQFLLIWLTGFCMGNLTAIAMEPMGHIAGFTASAAGAFSTLVAAGLATWLGSYFDGSVRPLFLAVLVLAAIGLALMLRMAQIDRSR